MKLGEFIERYVDKNVVIRLWRPKKKNKPHGDLEIVSREFMEWIVGTSEALSDIEFLFVTDVISENSRQIINLVVQTDLQRITVDKIIDTRAVEYFNDQMGFLDQREDD